jgi:tetratricopeptide (TPR) repeat protein
MTCSNARRNLPAPAPVRSAALAALGALALTSALAAPQLAQAQAMDPRNTGLLEACLAKAATAPDEAFEDGLRWRARSGGPDAEHCIAVARIENGDVQAGAQALVRVAGAPGRLTGPQRAGLLVKAANAWMLVDDLAPAEAALTRALELLGETGGGHSAILTDRARVRMLGGRWSDAQADLDRVLALGPDAFALRLRAEAQMQQGQLEAAEADVAAAEALEPRSVETNLVRGRIREARRLGQAPP